MPLKGFDREIEQIKREVKLAKEIFNDRFSSEKINAGERHNFILLRLYTKTLKTCNAALVLIQEGYEEDAMAVLRVALETIITLRYISENPEIN